MTPAEEAYLAHCLAVREARALEVKTQVADDWARQIATHPHYTVADRTIGPKGDR